jgi:superfamily II DNA or RNA helicase
MEPPDRSLGPSNALASYDPGSVQRGVRYAAEGRAAVLDLEPGWALGQVQGGRADPYVVEVTWRDGPRGLLVSDSCDCPLGGGCKHAVALILTVMRHRALAGTDHPSGPARALRFEPDWRTDLAGIAAEEPDLAPMALEFGVQTSTGARSAGPTTLQVTVRPVRMGARGRWIRTGAGWPEVASGHSWHLSGFNPDHVAALRSLAAGNSELAWSRRGGAALLDRFGPGVWRALRHAVDAGVTLVTERPGGIVRLAEDAGETHVDLRAGGDGGVVVTAAVTVDGRPLTQGLPHRLVGRPPTGVAVLDDHVLTLAPLARPVHDAIVPLLDGRAVHVPASDVDEFLDRYQPHLARAARVGSSDGSVTVEEPRFEGIVLLIEHRSVDTAALRWVARYQRGQRRTDHPLRSPGGVGRDPAAEAESLAGVELPTELLPGLADVSGRPADVTVSGVDTVVLFAQVVPWLIERAAVTVEVSGDAPTLRRAAGDPLIELDVDDPADADGGGNDWFDLSVRVSVDGVPVEFARLFTALTRAEPYLLLGDGTWIDLDRPELARLRELIEEARGLTGGHGTAAIRIDRFRTSWWDELTSLGVVASQSRRWQDQVSAMRTLTAPEPVAPPEGLAAELRPYQREGLDWLAFLHRNGLGGVLADDMGLGKTVQTLALFLHVLERDPHARFLVVAPTSVVENWHREAGRFAPGVEVRTVRATQARRGASLADAIGHARVVITSYALFRLEFEEYEALRWDVLVLDEAQFSKNPRSKAYRCARRLDAGTKLAITGTPIENSLMDLWSLLSITAPGLYPDLQRFNEVYRTPIESGRAPQRLATLRRRIAPLVRRRTKDEVLTELPPKTEQVVEIELSPRHERIYQAQLQRQRQKVLGLVGDVDGHRFEILRSLTVLRQLSLDPVLVDDTHGDVGSAKIDRLISDLTEVVAEGHKALVFSQFTRFLGLVRDRLDRAGIDHSYLDGRTRRREEAISSFRDGDVPVFVISLKAGGFGLNLTEADYCFVLDPWWNPAAETQAVDRAHRIGQRNPVMVYRYVSAGTIEEKVVDLQQRKSALSASVLDDDAALSGALEADDIRALFDVEG